MKSGFIFIHKNKKMKKYLSIIVFIGISVSLFQSCKDSSAFSKQSGEDPTLTSSDHLTMAVLYQQTAAEYRALCYQAFNVAKYQLDQNLRIMGLQKQQAIVLDIDETVLDNSPYEAKCILENVNYPDYWDEWMNASNAESVPGVLEFLKYAESKGIEVYYITNRNEKYRDQTLNNLKSLDFPFAINDHLLMKTDESSKKSRRDLVSETCKIILLIGDNLNDFSEVFEKKPIPERFELTDKDQQEFGKRFIILPNAMYGEWEGALYNYDFSKNNIEKQELRNEHLKKF